MNIIDAIKDEHLFRPFFGDDLSSWRAWLIAMRVLGGTPVKSSYGRDLIRQCTGRNPDKLPTDGRGFDVAIFLTGRRSGKSRMAATIAAHCAALAGLEKRLAIGERGIVPVVSPSKRQSHVVKDYLRGIFNCTPMLAQEVATDRKWEGFTLKTGVQLEMLAGDYRHVRGFSLLAVVLDEICFFGAEDDSKVKSDTELVRALTPALATTGGRMIAISSPYAKRGWTYEQYTKHWANDRSETLVWNAPSKVMNPTLKQSIIDRAMAEDLAAAKSEYMGEFRDDVGIFVPRELVENLVVKHRYENMPHPGIRYFAFCDLSGGRSDASALCIGHRENRKIIIDSLKWWQPPFSPYAVVGEMARVLERWGIRHVTGDNYSADFVSEAFKAHGIKFNKCEKNKNVLYAELLPVLTAGEIELLDIKKSIDQLAGLERRTRAGGRDIIDHPARKFDDLVNTIAGVAVGCSQKRIRVGCAGF